MIVSIKQDTDVNKYRSIKANDLINQTDNDIIGNIPINISSSNQNLNLQKSLLEPYNPRELSMENLIEGDLDEDYTPSDSESDSEDDGNDESDSEDDYDKGKRSKNIKRVRFDVDEYDKEKLPTKKKLYISDSESDDDDDDDDYEDSDDDSESEDEEYYKRKYRSDRYKEYEF